MIKHNSTSLISMGLQSSKVVPAQVILVQQSHLHSINCRHNNTTLKDLSVSASLSRGRTSMPGSLCRLLHFEVSPLKERLVRQQSANLPSCYVAKPDREDIFPAKDLGCSYTAKSLATTGSHSRANNGVK